MKTLLALGVCLFGLKASANDIEPGKEFYKVVFAPNPIVLDGNLGEWSGVPVLADPKFAVPKYSGTNAAPKYVLFEEYNGGTWTGPDDHTSAVQIVYDADNVYFGFVVTDDYHENAANSAWNGDSVQLMIASADRKSQVALYNYALGGVEAATGEVIVQHEAGPGGTEAVITRNGTTKRTTYEIKLPKEALGLESLRGGPQFGLGMAINDGDELTPGQKGWGGLGAHSIVFGKTPAETALITLAKGNDIEPGKEFYTALRTTAAITLDGSLKEWTGAPVLSDPKFATPKYSGTNANPKYVLFEEYNGGTWTGPSDQTSAVQIVYDAENVYFGFVVTDDFHENAANSAWNGDSVQLMIASADRTAQVALYNYALGGIENGIGDVIVQHEAGPGGTEAVISRDGANKKTTYEIKLPVESLGLAAPLTIGTQFGLGMAINDGDELTPGQKGWGGLGAHSIVFGKTPSQTALVTLGSTVSGSDRLFLSSINPSILTFTFRVNDKGTSILNPASAKLTIDGQAVTLTAGAKVVDATDFTYSRTTQFAAGNHTYAIEVRDAQGNVVTDSGTFRAANVPVFAKAQQAATVDKTKPGFIWRMFQNEITPTTTLAEAELALTGKLLDGSGAVVPNNADPAAAGIAIAAGTKDGAVIKYEIPTVINVSLFAGDANGNFQPDDQIPGIPGVTAGDFGIVAEVTTYVDLPAGLITMGVNSRDGFRSQGGNIGKPTDGTLLGEFEGDRGATDSLFRFVVQDAGVYGLRTVWRQASGLTVLEWFTVKADGTKVLLNDTANGGLSAYRVGTGPSPIPPGIPVAPNLSVAAARTTPGDGLFGEYWKRGVNTIKTDGNTVPANRIDAQIATFGAPRGTFLAKILSYTGNDLTAVPGWLGGDSASYSGIPGNLDDGAFRFTGFINITAPGTLNIGTTSDDGSRIKIAGIDIIDNDGGHGDATVDKDVSFTAAGIYPIEITFFNGDWTSDGDNHSGSTDPALHGGANFHLRIKGANVTPAQVATYFYTAPLPNYVSARMSVAAPRTAVGDGLYGEYWQRGVNTIKTDGNTVPANRIDTQIASFGAPSGTFAAKALSYTGNDLSPVPAWLAGDTASFSGKPGNLDDGAFRFSGFISIKAAGKLNIGTTSDDGSRVKIAGMDIIANDGGHGDATVDADVNFAAAGVYPIEITYFNGDWTSDGDNHSGSTDPAIHGGANFHFRVNGSNITPAQVGTYLHTAPAPNYVHARNAAGTALTGDGDGLNGEYWQRGVNTIKTDGNTVAANRIDAQIASFGAPSGKFAAKLLTYTGNDLSLVPAWLAGDSASFSGTPGNLDDGAFRFTGFINVAAPGKLNIGTTSDDGSRVKVAGMDIIANDGGHGDATVDADVNFGAAGVYPIEITFFNGDWTSDGNNHSGSPDPALHGGANFHFRVNGANITAEGAKMLFRTVDGKPVVAPKKVAWVSFHEDDNKPTTAAAAAGFTKAPDVGYTDLLKANGYQVTRFKSVDSANVSSLSSADLVIISRSVASGHYQQADETATWNGLGKPLIVMGGYIMRNSRLGFTTGATIPDTSGTISLKINDPAHPIFAGVALGADNVMANPYAKLVTYAGGVQRGISVNTDPVAGSGKILATVGTAGDAANGGLVIGEWTAGAVMGDAAKDVLGGPRLVFLSGSREQVITSEGAGIFDLDPDGAKLFLNAVAYMANKVVAEPLVFSSIVLSGNNLTLTWKGGGTLEQAVSVTGPWTQVSGASPHTVPSSGAGAFFRLRR